MAYPFVLTAIASEARPIVGATTRLSGFGDWILHCAIIQPASIAPVQATLPGFKQLVNGGNCSTLVQTGLYSSVEVQSVAAHTLGIWEHNT